MQMDSPEEKCLACDHYGFCQVYWGIDCKRQGGYKIPRMKSLSKETGLKVAMTKVEQPKKQRDKKFQILEPIRTKVANW